MGKSLVSNQGCGVLHYLEYCVSHTINYNSSFFVKGHIKYNNQTPHEMTMEGNFGVGKYADAMRHTLVSHRIYTYLILLLLLLHSFKLPTDQSEQRTGEGMPRRHARNGGR